MDDRLYVRRGLLASGFTAREVKRMQRIGQLCAVRRGIYVSGVLPDGPEARHVLRVQAAMRQLSPDAVVSHVSAALVHGLPVWAVPLDRVHVTRNRRRSGGRRHPGIHVHSAPLCADDVVIVRGLPVTSIERTLADLARSRPLEQAVVVLDAALARGWTTPAAVLAALGRQVRWPGVAAARRALAFADGRSESVGESRSRVAIARAGLPEPIPQWEVRTPMGRVIGRVDFGWPKLRAIGEFDGKVKYTRLLLPGQSAADAVYEEKLREDALRDLGFAVVRWTWPELDAFDAVAARLRRHFR
jgi:hypothetical protein